MNFIKEVDRKMKRAVAITKAKVFNIGISAFWWSKKVNFGDLLTPELISQYGFVPFETPSEDADIIGVGSLMNMIPNDYRGVILGTGIIDDREIRLEQAVFAAVRGELSKHNLGLPKNTPTGDLGLLAFALLEEKPSRKKYAIGLVPHYVDKNHPWVHEIKNQLGDKGCIIEVQDTARNVANQIAECDLIVSSSLHGIIVSDALGIPNVWIELSENVLGKGFKFWDYNTSIDYEQSPLKISLETSIKTLEDNASSKNFGLISEKRIELEKIFLNVLDDCKK